VRAYVYGVPPGCSASDAASFLSLRSSAIRAGIAALAYGVAAGTGGET
jgi:hypothetical protein